MVAHHTFVLPITVKALAVTRTHLGIAAPNLLFATAADDVWMVDRRIVEPRRPVGEPKDHEKAEGLLQYSPHLPFRHSMLLTHGLRVPRLHTVLATPSQFESTTIVIGIGACCAAVLSAST